MHLTVLDLQPSLRQSLLEMAQPEASAKGLLICTHREKGSLPASLPAQEGTLHSVCTIQGVLCITLRLSAPPEKRSPLSVSGQPNQALGCRPSVVKRLNCSTGWICVFLPTLAPGLRQCLLFGEGEREVSPGPRWPTGKPCY